MTDKPRVSSLTEAIERRVHAVPGDWSIEEHGDGYALYSGRTGSDGPEGIFGARHGLNLVNLKEPDHRWAQVKEFLENAHADVLWLLQENARLAFATQALAADLRAIGDLCGMTDDEYPLKAVQRFVREHERLQRENDELKKVCPPDYPKHLLGMKMSDRAKFRPANFDQLTDEQKWAIDKKLGILDWSGDPNE